MRGWQIDTLGHPATLRDLPDPKPRKGEALVRIAACGLNFADLLMAEGKYQDRPALPFVPGLEFAGTVAALGPDTDGPPSARGWPAMPDRAVWPRPSAFRQVTLSRSPTA